MNKGFMMYEALVMLLIVSITIIQSLNINHKLMTNTNDINNKIDQDIIKKYSYIKGCDLNCLTKKVLLP